MWRALSSATVEAEPQVGLSARVYLYFAALLVLYGGLETCLSGWLTTFALRYGDKTLAVSEYTTLLLWMSLTVGRVGASAVMLRVGEKTVQRWGLGLAAVFTAALAMAHSAVTIAAFAVLLGLSLAPFFPATWALLMAERPTARQAGIVLAVSGLGAAALPWMMGVVSTQTGSLQVALALPFAAALGLLGMSWFTAEASCRHGLIFQRPRAYNRGMDGVELLPVEIAEALERGATVVTGNQRAARALRRGWDQRNREVGAHKLGAGGSDGVGRVDGRVVAWAGGRRTCCAVAAEPNAGARGVANNSGGGRGARESADGGFTGRDGGGCVAAGFELRGPRADAWNVQGARIRGRFSDGRERLNGCARRRVFWLQRSWRRRCAGHWRSGRLSLRWPTLRWWGSMR